MKRVLLVVLSTLMVLGCGESPDEVSAPQSGQTAETRLRTELGIPADAPRVLIISQSSHLDWDWLRTFEDYFEHSVDGIFMDALGLMTQYHSAPHHYFYSIAEMGFFQRFVQAHPDFVEPLRQVGQDLRIVGGGITSPDNLLPSGEAFIRDYLVGKTWVDGTLGLPIRQAWLPDDFGHDAQLPIVLEGMGFQGVGFARVPGVETSSRFSGLDPPVPQSIAEDLLQTGIDFVWQARDGSQALAHWMPASYCQGDSFGHAISTVDDIAQLLAVNAPASPTPYVFVPVGCDFAPPNPNLIDVVDAWNAQQYALTGVWAVVATFDHYEQLVAEHRHLLRTRRFDPTPYWTGFYASRSLLKGMHLRATQALLGAEIFGAIADAAGRDDETAWLQRVRSRTEAIHAGWATLVPGNHHDFVTGTALDRVYQGEQIPQLTNALAQGEAERTRAMSEIVAAIAPGQGGERTVVVFNQLGFTRQGLAEVDGPLDDLLPESLRQPSADGGTLFMAAAPSLGYVTGDAASVVVPAERRVSLSVSLDGSAVVLENAFLRATIRRDAGWSLTSVVDKSTMHEMVASGAAANTFRIYADDGGLYRFGNEMEGCSLTPISDAAAEQALGDAMVLESGPLRARVTAAVSIHGQMFQKEYQLIADEPFLRIRGTGAAPLGTSVMVHFALAGQIDDVAYGTPYHWDHKAPARAGDLTFEATHDFVEPHFHGVPLGAVFHAGVPAWAIQPDGTLIGALWRNARQEVCDIYGASGTDSEEHTADYALRVASGMADPQQGRQLREALAFHTPLQTMAGTASGTLPRTFSLASATPDSAIITAAKSGTVDPTMLVLRLYQPTDAPLNVHLHTAAALRVPPAWSLDIHGRTALESELSSTSEARLRLSGTADQIDCVAARALTSVAITKR